MFNRKYIKTNIVLFAIACRVRNLPVGFLYPTTVGSVDGSGIRRSPPRMVLKPVVNGINYLSLNRCSPDFRTINRISRFLFWCYHLPGALGALAFALLLATCLRSVRQGSWDHGTHPFWGSNFGCKSVSYLKK